MEKYRDFRGKTASVLIVNLTGLLVWELHSFDGRCMNLDREFWWNDK
jgi:hypothetical protein